MFFIPPPQFGIKSTVAYDNDTYKEQVSQEPLLHFSVDAHLKNPDFAPLEHEKFNYLQLTHSKRKTD